MKLGIKNTGMCKVQDVSLNTKVYGKRFTITPCVETKWRYWLDFYRMHQKHLPGEPRNTTIRRYDIAEIALNNSVIPNVNVIIGDPIFPSSVTFVNGESGTGKTTFLLQVCGEYAIKGYKTGFISGEQNIHFVRQICKRCYVHDIDIGNITDIDEIIKVMSNYEILVIDSFPCITYDISKYGKMSKTAEMDFKLSKIISVAHELNCAVIVVLHSTKSGTYKGPTTLKHAVENMIRLERAENGKINIILEKSRLSPPAQIQLPFGNNGYDYIRSFRLFDNDLLCKRLKNIMCNLYTDPPNWYDENWLHYTYDFCDTFLPFCDDEDCKECIQMMKDSIKHYNIEKENEQ